MNYAIAYCDMLGNGYSMLEPYIYDDIEDLEDAKLQLDSMVKSGYKNVTIFEYDEDTLPEYVSWNFILERKIDLK